MVAYIASAQRQHRRACSLHLQDPLAIVLNGGDECLLLGFRQILAKRRAVPAHADGIAAAAAPLLMAGLQHANTT